MGRIEAVTAEEQASAFHQHAYAALVHLGYSEFLSLQPSTH
ncbi:hypothetical protein QRX50_36330 [Amycolatopsis carbonis]|uniref:Uncharacterized protein n=1 Tax=Amycolatopsis carbonis TaxID=715471 RepID=A0A9Y2MVL5_9PSEU|nr:hypothetical protein [Amycolatopsis sp. 2-15]WIX76857.1 hypothetical protein QRX50_36330 [Amycolatopsis sp. 2-15]